jgi:hypothetical protein
LTASGIVTLGRAVTHGQALPLGIDDPVIAARAVRRALADAGRQAADVSVLVLASPLPVDAVTLGRFVRRALGPHGSAERTSGLEIEGVDAEMLAARAGAHVRDDLPPGGIGIAVGLDDGGDVVALCLSRATTARAADLPPGAA